MKIKLTLTDQFILIAIASTMLYIVSENLPFGLGSFRFIWGPLSLIVILISRPKAYSYGPIRIILLLIFLFVGVLQYLLWNFMDEFNRRLLFEDSYALLVFSSMWSYFMVKSDFEKLAVISKYAFVFSLITIIGTNLALNIDPNIVRESAAGYRENANQIALAKYTGLASYGYSQALVLLIPVLVFHIKKRKPIIFSHKVLRIVLIVLLLTIIRSNVFANLLIAAFITFLSILGSKKPIALFSYLVFFLFIFVVIPNTVYSNIFSYFGSLFESGSEMNTKLNDFAFFILNPELDNSTGAASRVERYPLLFDAFLSNPLFGVSSFRYSIDISEGGHLYWMNKLVQIGLLGFLFYIAVLYKLYRNIISVFNDAEIRYYYLLSIIAFIVIGLTKNMDGREPWLMIILIIPGLYILPFSSKKLISNGKKIKRNAD